MERWDGGSADGSGIGVVGDEVAWLGGLRVAGAVVWGIVAGRGADMRIEAG